MKKYSVIKKKICKNDGEVEDILIIRIMVNKECGLLLSRQDRQFMSKQYKASNLYSYIMIIPETVEIRFEGDVVFFNVDEEFLYGCENSLYDFKKYLNNAGYKVINLSLSLENTFKDIENKKIRDEVLSMVRPPQIQHGVYKPDEFWETECTE